MNGSITFDGSLVGDISGGGGGGDEVIITPVVTSGTKIADVSVNGVEKDLYCPTPPAPTEVDITPVVTSGTKIADVSVNGVEKDLYCPTPPTPTEVDITPVVTSGTKIADVSIGGVEKDLYAPDYGADITALDGRLDTAEGNITSLTGRVGTAEGNITSLTGRVGTAEGNITSLTDRVGTAEGNITSLTGRVGTAENDITALGIECDAIAADLAAPYDDESTYSKGDYCTHNKVLYQCNTDISTAEEWDSTHWTSVKVTEDITEIKQSLSQKVNKGWTLFSTTVPTAGNPTPLPSEFDELLISVSFNAPNGWHSSEFLIPKELLSSTSVKHAAGWYYSASDCASFMVQLDNTEITQVSTTRGGASITAYMQAYYR